MKKEKRNETLQERSFRIRDAEREFDFKRLGKKSPTMTEPCPNCACAGEIDFVSDDSKTPEQGGFRAKCTNCGLSAGLGDTPNQAAALWSRRRQMTRPLSTCRFCGGHAKVFVNNNSSSIDDDEDYVKSWVECTNCSAKTSEHFGDSAISIWNGQ